MHVPIRSTVDSRSGHSTLITRPSALPAIFNSPFNPSPYLQSILPPHNQPNNQIIITTLRQWFVCQTRAVLRRMCHQLVETICILCANKISQLKPLMMGTNFQRQWKCSAKFMHQWIVSTSWIIMREILFCFYSRLTEAMLHIALQLNKSQMIESTLDRQNSCFHSYFRFFV